jgi:enoyl-CoA hydratase
MKGFCYGAGLELAAACDLRVAAHDAHLAMPEVKHGLLPAYGGTQRLARLMGKGRALSFLLFRDPIDAPAAHQAGLVDLLVPPGEAEAAALRWAATLAGYEPHALAAIKQAIPAEAAATIVGQTSRPVLVER